MIKALLKRVGFVSAGEVSKKIEAMRLDILRREFSGAGINRLTADWLASTQSMDAAISGGVLVTLINRCREMENNDDYMRGYLGQLENNILGEYGIGLQMKIKDPDGTFDTQANNKVEAAWAEWSKPENCSHDGQRSLCALDELVLRREAVDGGILLRQVNGGAFGITFQPIEIDQLDLDHNAAFPNGNFVRMGVEYGLGGVQAFWILERHPGDLGIVGRGNNMRRLRIPAAEIIHVTHRTRVGQTHGLPHAISTMLRMKNIRAYEEAEVICARLSACKGMAIENPITTEFAGGGVNEIEDMEPGATMNLPPGSKYVAINPTHPNEVFPAFIKQQLRGAASGLEISYTAMANDLEATSYSSIRAGLLAERDSYKKKQRRFIENCRQKMFDRWLPFAFISGKLNLPQSKFAKFNYPEWKPRRWPWVDPEKDINSAIKAVEKGFDSRRSIISDAGGDVEDVFQSIGDDEKLAAKYGLNFPIGMNPQEPQVAPEKNPVDNDG